MYIVKMYGTYRKGKKIVTTVKIINDVRERVSII